MAAWKCKQKLKKPFHFSVLSLKVGWGRLIQKILIRKNEFANHRNPNSYMVRFYYSISVLYLYPLSVCVTVNLTDTESAYLHFFICIQKSRRGPTQCIFNFLSKKKFVVRKSGKRVAAPPPQSPCLFWRYLCNTGYCSFYVYTPNTLLQTRQNISLL